MGCNSHLLIEYKPWPTSGWWGYASDLAESRDYLMYGLMAGVRGDATPIAQPRGVPPDSVEFKEFYEEYGDGHTPSWLTPEEFNTVTVEAVKLRLEARGDDEKWKGEDTLSKEWVILRNLLNDLKENYGNDRVRLCFYFDN